MPLRPNRLKQARASKHMTQTDLARTLGVPQQQVNRWETGVNDPASDVLARMAQILECSADWLLGLVEATSEHSGERPLSEHEQLLIELYRQNKLPQLISRLVNELSGGQAKDTLAVDSPQQSIISGREEAIDS